jgi:hypothetical protein
MMGGGGSSGGDQTKQTEVVVPDWVQAQVEQNIATANQLAATAYQTPPINVAAMTPDQLQAIQQITALQGSTTGQFDQAISQVSNLPQSINTLLSPYIPGAEQTAVQQIQRSGAQTGQQIAAGAVGAGALGGSRYGVEQSLNDSQVQQQIAAAVNQISSGGFTQAANAALTGATDEGKLAGAGLTAALTGDSALYQVGQQQQAQQQAEYSAALQQWQAQQNWPYQQLAIEQSALAGSPYGNTTTSTQPYNSNALASALGIGASALPLVKNLSDWTGLTGAISSAFAPAAADAGASAAIGTAADVGLTSAAGYGAAAAGTAAAADAAGTAAAGAAGKGASDVVAAAPLLLA